MLYDSFLLQNADYTSQHISTLRCLRYPFNNTLPSVLIPSPVIFTFYLHTYQSFNAPSDKLPPFFAVLSFQLHSTPHSQHICEHPTNQLLFLLIHTPHLHTLSFKPLPFFLYSSPLLLSHTLNAYTLHLSLSILNTPILSCASLCSNKQSTHSFQLLTLLTLLITSNIHTKPFHMPSTAHLHHSYASSTHPCQCVSQQT